MNRIEWRDMVFDDFVAHDEQERKEYGTWGWSQVCPKHADMIKEARGDNLLDDCGSGICGVEGCNEDGEYYIDFPLKEVFPK